MSREGDTALVTLRKRGQEFERLGQRMDARTLYETALDACESAEPSSRAQLLRWIARTHMQDSNYQKADLSAEAALRISDAASDEGGRGHAMNMLASIRWSQSDLDAAETLFLAARASAKRAGESRLAAMTALNLGAIASVRGDHAEALRYQQSSLEEARTAGHAHEVMKALNNLGLVHAQTERFVDADRAFAEALEIGRALGDLSMCIVAQLNVARLRIRQGDYDGARESCDEATSLASRLGETHAEGEGEHIYGIIARAADDEIAAERHFLRAEIAAVTRLDRILEGETACELADLYRAQGRNRETLQRLNQAHGLFTQLRARRELADVGRRTAALERDFLEVVRKWGDSIESKDRYTQGHCVRVADLACALWSDISGGDATSQFWFRIGALLHDVGKLMVPAEVLNKAGALTPEEWTIVRGHPGAGVTLLADIDFPWDVRPIIESHHERWDGKGYPHRLAGEAIPLTARVLCIADVYDALTSERSYKRALSHDDAMAIMRADIGKQFDPVVFARFEEVVSRVIPIASLGIAS